MTRSSFVLQASQVQAYGVRRMSRSRCTSRDRHRLRQDSGRLQVQAYGVLPHIRIQVSLSAFLPHRWVRGTGVADVVGSSTWRANAAALWITSVEDTASTYDFHSPTVRQAYIKIGFVCLLDYFAFLTCLFTCFSGWLRITTR
jgi:hypothetical protein